MLSRALSIGLVAGLAGFGTPAIAASVKAQPAKFEKLNRADRIVAVVDDDPISEYQIKQRTLLVRALGGPKLKPAKMRETVLKQLVNEVLQRHEAKRLKIKVNAKQIEATIGNMAKRAGQTLPQIKSKLSKSGISYKTLQEQVRTTIAWNAVVRRRFSRQVSVNAADVKLKLENIKKDPRRSQKLVVLKQVLLPINSSMPGLQRSRQAEAIQIYRGFKGCRSLKRLTSAIFNVQVKGPPPVPLKALDPRLRKMLVKMGPGKITPPGLGKAGIQMIAYCSNKILKAPEVTAKQMENVLYNQQLSLHAERHLRDLNRDAIVEYR